MLHYHLNHTCIKDLNPLRDLLAEIMFRNLFIDSLEHLWSRKSDFVVDDIIPLLPQVKHHRLTC